MTISKERLSELALEVWGYSSAGLSETDDVIFYAHALLKRVEAEHKATHRTLFIALPLVEGD